MCEERALRLRIAAPAAILVSMAALSSSTACFLLPLAPVAVAKRAIDGDIKGSKMPNFPQSVPQGLDEFLNALRPKLPPPVGGIEPRTKRLAVDDNGSDRDNLRFSVFAIGDFDADSAKSFAATVDELRKKYLNGSPAKLEVFRDVAYRQKVAEFDLK